MKWIWALLGAAVGAIGSAIKIAFDFVSGGRDRRLERAQRVANLENDVRSELRKLRNTWRERSRRAESELEEAREEIDRLEGRVESLESERDRLEARVDGLCDRISDYQREFVELHQAYDALWAVLERETEINPRQSEVG